MAEPIRLRAAMGVLGLNRGEVSTFDPEVEVVGHCIRRGLLVPVDVDVHESAQDAARQSTSPSKRRGRKPKAEAPEEALAPEAAIHSDVEASSDEAPDEAPVEGDDG